MNCLVLGLYAFRSNSVEDRDYHLVASTCPAKIILDEPSCQIAVKSNFIDHSVV